VRKSPGNSEARGGGGRAAPRAPSRDCPAACGETLGQQTPTLQPREDAMAKRVGVSSQELWHRGREQGERSSREKLLWTDHNPLFSLHCSEGGGKAEDLEMKE